MKNMNIYQFKSIPPTLYIYAILSLLQSFNSVEFSSE